MATKATKTTPLATAKPGTFRVTREIVIAEWDLAADGDDPVLSAFHAIGENWGSHCEPSSYRFPGPDSGSVVVVDIGLDRA